MQYFFAFAAKLEELREKRRARIHFKPFILQINIIIYPKAKKPLKRKFERINGVLFYPQLYPHMWITYCNILPVGGAYPLPYR